jgi:hypothetical protein
MLGWHRRVGANLDGRIRAPVKIATPPGRASRSLRKGIGLVGAKSRRWPAISWLEQALLSEFLETPALIRREFLTNAFAHLAEDLLYIRFEDPEIIGDQLLVAANDLIDPGLLLGSQIGQMIHCAPAILKSIPEWLRHFNPAGASHQQPASDHAGGENDDGGQDDQNDFPEAHQVAFPSSVETRMVCSRSWEKLATESISAPGTNEERHKARVMTAQAPAPHQRARAHNAHSSRGATDLRRAMMRCSKAKGT